MTHTLSPDTVIVVRAMAALVHDLDAAVEACDPQRKEKLHGEAVEKLQRQLAVADDRTRRYRIAMKCLVQRVDYWKVKEDIRRSRAHTPDRDAAQIVAEAEGTVVQ